MEFTNIPLIYFCAINVITFLCYGLDKLKAKRGSRRISEASLLTLALLGGSIGAWLAMKAFHHKTLHKKFTIGVPVIFILQVILVVAFWRSIVQ